MGHLISVENFSARVFGCTHKCLSNHYAIGPTFALIRTLFKCMKEWKVNMHMGTNIILTFDSKAYPRKELVKLHVHFILVNFVNLLLSFSLDFHLPKTIFTPLIFRLKAVSTRIFWFLLKFKLPTVNWKPTLYCQNKLFFRLRMQSASSCY